MWPLLPEAMSSPFLYRIKRFTSVNRMESWTHVNWLTSPFREHKWTDAGA
jgi:hypothetical protein